MNSETIARRIEAAAEYLTHLVRLGTSHQWLDAYERFQIDDLGVTESLALVHPRHLGATTDLDAVRGHRRFNERTSAQWCQCQSVVVWGYECPLESATFEADHLFPFEAGGPTVADNRIWLCPTHNRVKSSDVHLFPWEHGVPPWVEERLAVMAARLRQ